MSMSEFSSPVIEYTESPTGKAYIGINKLPLMKHDRGHGFKGVLVQTDDKKSIQCSVCGKWFEFLHGSHLRKCGVTTEQYKKTFGLHRNTGLISDECSLKRTKWLLTERGKLHIQNKTAQILRLHSEGRSGAIPRDNGKRCMEAKNARGLCPEQLKARLREFILSNRELPSNYNRGVLVAQALKRNYGSIGAGLIAHGLPRRSRWGRSRRKHYFPDGDCIELDLSCMPERDILFQIMLRKCPILA